MIIPAIVLMKRMFQDKEEEDKLNKKIKKQRD